MPAYDPQQGDAVTHKVEPGTIYVVPVSGGKDSQVCLAWALGCVPRQQLRVVHQNTGYDHPLTYAHLRYISRRYGVKIEHTYSTKYDDVFDLIRKVGYFPNSVARSCTSRLKQQPFAEWLRANFEITRPGAVHIFMGMRSDESRARNDKYGDYAWDQVLTLPDISGEYSGEFRHVTVSLPIVEMSTAQVFEFLKDRGDKLNPLYAKGHLRVGCYPCLLARNSEWEAAASDPTGREHIQKLIQIEDEFTANGNPRKLVKIHQTRDVRALLASGKSCNPDDDKECGWCSI